MIKVYEDSTFDNISNQFQLPKTIESVFCCRKIPEVLLVNNTKFIDDRGYFVEQFNIEEHFYKILNGNYNNEIKDLVLQDNISCSRYNVIRGLHYQTDPFAQGKLISVLKGKILDVFVDIRPDSKTYGQHSSYILDNSHNYLYIPPGFAHGFRALDYENIVSYKVLFNFRDVLSERTLDPFDEDLNIDWHFGTSLTKDDMILSDKDRNGLGFKENEK